MSNEKMKPVVENQELSGVPKIETEEVPQNQEDLEACIDTFRSKITELKETSRKTTEEGIMKIDGLVEKLGVGDPEETAAVKAELLELESKEQSIFSRALEKIAAIGKKTGRPVRKSSLARPETIGRKSREKAEIWNNEPLVREARRQRNLILEKRELFDLSREDFEEFFVSKESEFQADLRQRNVGDCYLIAAIHAMSNSPHFEMIVRSSTKRLPDGSWEIKVPFMSREHRTINISLDETLPQENRNFHKLDDEGQIDRRRIFWPVGGKEGLQVLEAAYIKYKFGDVDRLKAEGGLGEDALLRLCGGDNFLIHKIDSAVYHRGGKVEEKRLNTLLGEDAEYLDYFLKSFDPEIHIATAGSMGTDRSTPKGWILDIVNSFKEDSGLAQILTGHEYSVSKVDPKKKIITIFDPHDTSKPIDLTFKEFKKKFSIISIARINSAKLLRNMDTITGEII